MLNVLATDNFNRADAGLGANWATITGAGNPLIVTNAVQTTAIGADSAARYTAVASPNNQYAQTKVIAYDDSAKGHGPVLRAASAANTYYRIISKGPSGASALIEIHKFVATTFTSLTSVTATTALNDLIRGEVFNNTITGYVAGVRKTVISDASIASGSFGIAVFADGGATSSSRVDDWEGGEIVDEAVPTFYNLFPKPTMQQPLMAGRTN